MKSFWSRVLDFFIRLFNWDPAEIAKKRALKAIYRDLKAISPSYYKRSHNYVLPGFSRVIYNFATLLKPIDELLKKTVRNKDPKLAARYNTFLFESQLEEEDRLKRYLFDYQEMKSRVFDSTDFEREILKLEAEFREYIGLFTTTGFENINSEMNEMNRLCGICRQSYESLLSLFDPKIDINRAKYKPFFNAIEGELVLQEIMDIYYILASFDISNGIEKNLHTLIERLRREGAQEQKDKISKNLNRIRRLLVKYLHPSILLKLIQAIKQDPYLIPKFDTESMNIIEEYIKEMSSQFKHDIERLEREINERAISHNLIGLFGTTGLEELEGYSEAEAAILETKGINGFIYIKPMQILKTFIMKKFDIVHREPLVKLIIEGFFEDKVFQSELANIYYKCEKTLGQIILFEENLMGSGKTSINTIRKYLAELHTNPNLNITLNNIIEMTNKKAQRILEEYTNLFNDLTGYLSQIMEDYKNKTPGIVGNIKTLGGTRNMEFINSLQKSYNSVIQLVNIMRIFIIVKPSPVQAH
ncbi:MAG: hypothetical protein JW969_15130 [Spirochaetales bacterium]|nr:hypothetical protein [Spirochaetales bacterium]